MTQLSISRDLQLPADYATRRVGIVAQSGGGKTYTASVIAEELVAIEQPFYALDPTGAWWGLRSSASGKRKGLPVIVIGGSHGDVPLDEHAGGEVAQLVVTSPNFYVIDLEGFETRAAEVRFATAFLDRLYRLKSKHRSPLHGFWDEADLFAPQKTFPNETKMLGAAENIIRRGRIRGLGTTMITQRPAVLNKNVLSQIDLLIALKVIDPRDRKAIKEYLDGVADPKLRDEVLDSLAGLDLGEAWLYGPGLRPPIYGRAKVRERKTFNSSADGGGEDVAEVKLADVDLGALRDRLAASIEKAKADDPAELRKQIQARERRIKELEAELDRKPPAERVEVPMLTDEQERDLKRIAGSLEDAGRRLADAHQLLEAVDGRVAKFVDAVQPPAAQPQTSSPPPAVRQPRASSPQPRALPASPARGMDGDGPQLPAGARKILETLARHHPMTFTRGQVGVLTGFKVSGGTFQKYWSLLKTSGYLLEENRLASVTEAGLERAGVEPAAPATTEEMLEMWSSRLPAGARAMLDHLVQMHPGWITRDELATAVEMTASGGTFQKYLSMLRTNGLADVEGGQVRASDSLFITGAVHA